MSIEKQTFKSRFKTEIVDKLSLKRIVIYCLGFFLIAIGISISAKSSLGVSPVNSVPYTVSLLSEIEQGVCTTGFFIILILVQFLISPKDFSPFSSDYMLVYFRLVCNSRKYMHILYFHSRKLYIKNVIHNHKSFLCCGRCFSLCKFRLSPSSK